MMMMITVVLRNGRRHCARRATGHALCAAGLQVLESCALQQHWPSACFDQLLRRAWPVELLHRQAAAHGTSTRDGGRHLQLGQSSTRWAGR